MVYIIGSLVPSGPVWPDTAEKERNGLRKGWIWISYVNLAPPANIWTQSAGHCRQNKRLCNMFCLANSTLFLRCDNISGSELIFFFLFLQNILFLLLFGTNWYFLVICGTKRNFFEPKGALVYSLVQVCSFWYYLI